MTVSDEFALNIRALGGAIHKQTQMLEKQAEETRALTEQLAKSREEFDKEQSASSRRLSWIAIGVSVVALMVSLVFQF